MHVPIEIKLLRSARGTFCPELIKAFSSGSGSGSNLTKRGADLCQLTRPGLGSLSANRRPVLRSRDQPRPIRGQHSGQLTNEKIGNYTASDLGAVKLILLLQRPWQQSLKRNCSDHLEQGTSFVLLSSQQKRHRLDIFYSEVVSH